MSTERIWTRFVFEKEALKAGGLDTTALKAGGLDTTALKIASSDCAKGWWTGHDYLLKRDCFLWEAHAEEILDTVFCIVES